MTERGTEAESERETGVASAPTQTHGRADSISREHAENTKDDGNRLLERPAGGEGQPSSSAAPSPSAVESARLPPGKDVSLQDQEVARLSLQIEEYYHSTQRWARSWMVMFILSLCIELFLTVVFILSFVISYQKELLPDATPAGNLITWWNVRALVATLFAMNLLILLSARFNKRWRLNQATVGRLADLKVDLAKSSDSLDDVRTTFKDILEKHNQGLKKQKMFTGPEIL